MSGQDNPERRQKNCFVRPYRRSKTRNVADNNKPEIQSRSSMSEGFKALQILKKETRVTYQTFNYDCQFPNGKVRVNTIKVCKLHRSEFEAHD